MTLNRLAMIKSKRLKPFIAFALKRGWEVKVSPMGNILLKRKGWATIYNASYLIEKSDYKIEQQVLHPVKKT